jgi:UDP-glucose 4-epimerase
MHWGKIYKIPIISIRIFNAYGPRSRTSNVYGAVIGVFLKQKLSKYPLTIIGNGKQKRDFLYISDLCDAFYKAAISKYENEIFNLGFGKSRTVLALANLISKKHIFIPWRSGEPKNTEADINKIEKYLKWSPKISLETGIKNVLKNIAYWKKAPLWTETTINKATANWNKFLK